MCSRNNVSLSELVDLYKRKLRQEMNEAYCSAREYPKSVVAVLEQQNKGKREEFWTPEWRKYKKTIYRTAKDNVLKFEKVAFPGVVFDARGGKRIKKNKSTSEVNNNKPKDNKRGKRMSATEENISFQNPRQGSFNKMPLDITFKLRSKPRLTLPVTTLDQAILNEIIQYFELTQVQYNEILHNVKEHYPDMIIREEEDEEQDVEEDDDDVTEDYDVTKDDDDKAHDDDDDDEEDGDDTENHDEDDEEDEDDDDDHDDDNDDDDEDEIVDYDPNEDGLEKYDSENDEDRKEEARIRARYPQMAFYKYAQYRWKKLKEKRMLENNAINTISLPESKVANVEDSSIRQSKRRKIENCHLKDYVH